MVSRRESDICTFLGVCVSTWAEWCLSLMDFNRFTGEGFWERPKFKFVDFESSIFSEFAYIHR